MKAKNKLFVIMIVVITLLIPGIQVSAKVIKTTEGSSSNNIHKHEYNWNYATPQTSFLIQKGNGYSRIEAIGDYVYIEDYSYDFSLISSKRIEMDLSRFGGFFEGEKYNFLVFGENNECEEDDFEIMLVVKYDKNWNRIGETSFTGDNTYSVFSTGGLSMAEYGGILYIRTCHEFFMNEDGEYDQSSMTVSINEETMAKVAIANRDLSVAYGYVSHSFNQMIKIINGKLTTVDHGNGSPRAVVLGRYPSNASTGSLSTNLYSNKFSYVKLFDISGTAGDEYTGVNVGAFESSSANYLVAINTVDQSKLGIKYVKNIKLLVQPIDNFSSSSTVTKTIMTYDESDNFSAGNPYLIPMENDQFALIWEEVKCPTSLSSAISQVFMNRIQLAVVDGNGNLVGDIITIPGALSDCKPIYQNGNLVWYVTSNGKPIFYSIHVNHPSHSLSHMGAVTATCCSEGNEEYWFCSGCQRVFSDEDGLNEIMLSDVIIPINKDAHVWNETTYVWEEDSAHATAQRICKIDSSHIETETVKISEELIEPDCKTKGVHRYIATFDNNVFSPMTKEIEIPAIGHSLVYVEEVSATCCQTGTEAYWQCTNCQQYFADETGETKLDAPIVISIDSDAHKWGEWMLTKEASLEEEGDWTRTCEHNSDHQEHRVIPKLIALTGTVVLSGEPKFGENITVSVSNSNCSGEFHYQWTREGKPIEGATSSTYYIGVNDIGYCIGCVVTSETEVGEITGEIESEIEKADGIAAPSGLTAVRPSKKGASDGKIFGIPDNCEYSTDAMFSDAISCEEQEISGLLAGTYYIRFAESETTKAGDYVTVIVEEGLPVLDTSAPVLLEAVAGDESITISWIANELVPQYAVFRKTKSGKWTKIDITTGTRDGSVADAGDDCFYVDQTAGKGIEYFYTVRGMDENGKYVTSYNTTGISTMIESTEELLDKKSPVLNKAVANENGITLTWYANSGVQKYTIFRKTAGGSWVKLQETTGTADGQKAEAGSECSFFDRTAIVNVTYFYTVRGMDTAGKYVTSYNTTGISAMIESAQEPLDKNSPVLKEAVADENGITLTWYANSGVQKYTIFRKKAGGSWTKLQETTGTADGQKADVGSECSFFDRTAVVNITYFYTVRGMDENGKYVTNYNTTGISAVMVGQQEVLDKNSPVLKEAVAGENGITIAWYANSGVQKYMIFRKTEGGKWTKLQETTGTADGQKAEAGSECCFVDNGASVGVTYIYSVRGMDSNGTYVTSYDTTGVSAMIAGQQEALDKSAPVLKEAVAGENGITVTWYANSGVQKYMVFRKTEGSKWTKLQETTGTADGLKAEAGSECHFVDNSASIGVVYIYSVRGMDGNGTYVTSYDVSGVSASIQE